MRSKLIQLLFLVGLAWFGLSGHAWAANAGGGSMPWDNPFTVLSQDLTGPIPKTLSLIGIATSGMMLVSGAEITHFARAIIVLVFVCSLLIGANNLFTAFGWGAGAEIAGRGASLTTVVPHVETGSYPQGR